MLPLSFCQSQDWLCAEPLLFDEDFCQSLIKDLQSLPTPPQSPPMKGAVGSCKPLSKEDQLSFVSDILLEDHDIQLSWNLFGSNGTEKEQRITSMDDGGEDGLWQCLGVDKSIDEKLVSVLGSSPYLSDIDTSIFEEIAGSTLDCHAAALACQILGNQDLPDSPEQSEATSGYGSAGGEFSSTSSSSDSEEEIDVVTVRRPSSPSSSLADHSLRQRKQEEDQLALQRHHFEIQQQHNYAAPCPASPPPPPPSSAKRQRGADSSRHHHPGRSTSSRHHHHHHQFQPSRQSTETEDEEERRRTHNVMERQRRNELKNCFMRLRDNVPELSHNDKASKVVILKRARDSIRSLEQTSQRLQAKKDKLRDRQEQFKARLEQLQS